MTASFFPPSFSGPSLYERTTTAWSRYGIEVRTLSYKGREHRYLVELGDPEEVKLSDLGLEFYSDALRKADVTSEGTLITFCKKFGIVTSMLYPGAMQLELFRSRKKPKGRTVYRPLDSSGDIPEPLLVAETLGATLEDSIPHINPVDGNSMEKNLPAILSERAREIESDNEEVAGAVSLLEVAQTVRLLQIATVLPVAVRYACENDWLTEQVRDYLSTKRFLSQSGARYFLHSNSDFYKGPGIKSFEDLVDSDADFASLMRSGIEAGYDVRALYETSVAQQFCLRATDCLEFLRSAGAYHHSQQRIVETLLKGSRKAMFRPFSKGWTPPNLATGTVRKPHGSLTLAIIEQFFDTFDDQTPYKRCKNCTKFFKFFQHGGNLRRSTEFCSKSCATSYAAKQKRNCS